MGAPTIRESRLGKGDKSRVPEAKQDARCKLDFPVGLLRDDVMHEREQTVRVILNLDVNVEFDVLVLRLMTKLTAMRCTGVRVIRREWTYLHK